ncbi:MAG TPA: cysteine desulfurase [Stellaceae bacterium]|jgi:cysteine desulfurase/selenocysteine lyase|nr:cysteine desulfurase [Stellaceae bacterium]
MDTLVADNPRAALDPRVLRREFPIFDNNPGLVFLDSGASAEKPRQVIDGLAEFYRRDYANVHRGVYALSARSTDRFEEAREKVRAFLNAADEREIVFVRGATEAINLVAQSWGPAHVQAGDEIVISDVEHHSNLVPWQMLRDRVGAKLLMAPTDETGEFDLAAFEAMLSPRTRLVAVTHVSNVTGALLPVERIVALAHRHGATVLVDGCQAIPRMPVDVQAIGCDFYAFSGHKAYGPTGTGVLYGRYAALDAMPPWQAGGGMILNVTLAHTDFQEPPHRFEAGTPDIAGAVGLSLAIDFIESIGRDAIRDHEEKLTGYAVDRLSRIPGLDLVGGGQRRISVLSFNLDGVHPHDVGTVLDQHNVAVRVGNHCAQPLMDKLGVAGTVRASLGIYNDEADIDRLAQAIEACREMFSR